MQLRWVQYVRKRILFLTFVLVKAMVEKIRSTTALEIGIIKRFIKIDASCIFPKSYNTKQFLFNSNREKPFEWSQELVQRLWYLSIHEITTNTIITIIANLVANTFSLIFFYSSHDSVSP